MTFDFSVPTPAGPKDFKVAPGTTLLFVGANGGGKTRLAVKIEEDLGDSPDEAQRNPGTFSQTAFPDCAALHPGYNRWHDYFGD